MKQNEGTLSVHDMHYKQCYHLELIVSKQIRNRAVQRCIISQFLTRHFKNCNKKTTINEINNNGMETKFNCC